MSIHQSNCSHSLKIKYHLRMLDLSNNIRESRHYCPTLQTCHSLDSAFIINSTLFHKVALQGSYMHGYENVTCPCSTHGNVSWNVFSSGWLKKINVPKGS
jgi:cytochrome oxidase assembly protein ShyY1